MSRYRGRNSLKKTLKDYIVPIIGGIFILLILFKVFAGSQDQALVDTNSPREQTISAFDISFKNDMTEAFITYGGNTVEQINESINLYIGESITVREGVVELKGNNGSTVTLNRIAEFGYEGENQYSIKSSDVFMTLGAESTISMRYATIVSPAGSTLSLTQNEAGSSIYVLAGSAKVANLARVDTTLIAGQKISISRLAASDEEIDLASEKTDIDSFFKSSDWFLDNQGHMILEQSQNQEGEENEDISGESGGYISFSNLRDEMSSDSATLLISGNINSDEVEIITINNAQVERNGEDFSRTINLLSGINDIVIKIFNSEKDILEKKVFTVYSSAENTPPNNSNTSTNINSSNSGITTYNVNANDFAVTEPSTTGKYTTNFGEVTIRGITSAEGISKVEVNGFELGSFNGSTWRYHAFERFETIEEGTNQYRIDYFGEDGEIVYTDYFTIVKQSAQSSSAETNSSSQEIAEEIISDEA